MTDTIKAALTLREFGGDITMRQVFLGAQPIVLIEAEEDDEGDVIFNVDATGLEQDELADVLEGLVEILRNGEEE